jgi:hypothetical protein
LQIITEEIVRGKTSNNKRTNIEGLWNPWQSTKCLPIWLNSDMIKKDACFFLKWIDRWSAWWSLATTDIHDLSIQYSVYTSSYVTGKMPNHNILNDCIYERQRAPFLTNPDNLKGSTIPLSLSLTHTPFFAYIQSVTWKERPFNSPQTPTPHWKYNVKDSGVSLLLLASHCLCLVI